MSHDLFCSTNKLPEDQSNVVFGSFYLTAAASTYHEPSVCKVWTQAAGTVYVISLDQASVRQP